MMAKKRKEIAVVEGPGLYQLLLTLMIADSTMRVRLGTISLIFFLYTVDYDNSNRREKQKKVRVIQY